MFHLTQKFSVRSNIRIKMGLDKTTVLHPQSLKLFSKPQMSKCKCHLSKQVVNVSLQTQIWNECPLLPQTTQAKWQVVPLPYFKQTSGLLDLVNGLPSGGLKDTLSGHIFRAGHTPLSSRVGSIYCRPHFCKNKITISDLVNNYSLQYPYICVPVGGT
jgi:hypothetical protein